MYPNNGYTVVWAPVLCITQSPQPHYHVITTPCHHHHPENTYRGRTTVKPSFGPNIYIYIYRYSLEM